jgi:hypothetical protein
MKSNSIAAILTAPSLAGQKPLAQNAALTGVCQKEH